VLLLAPYRISPSKEMTKIVFMTKIVEMAKKPFV
jgi:hypothetical protein